MNSNSSLMYLLFCTFSIICQLSSADLKSYNAESYLNVRYKPLAININTKNLEKCISTTPSLYVTATASTETILVNTGQSVQTLNQIKEAAQGTGGPLGQNTDRLDYFIYYWTRSNSSEVTGTKIDGEGFPYEARLFNKNTKYPNLTEAVKHKDGIFEFVFVFRICSKINEPFSELSRLIQKVSKAGSFTIASTITQIKAIDFIPLNSIYYSYKGIIQDVFTGKKYKCSTVVVVKPNPEYCITQKQFDDTFGPLKNFRGKSFANTLNRDPSTPKVEKCQIVTQTIFP